MSKVDGKKLELDKNKQLSFDFVESGEYNVQFLGETKEGYGLFRKKEAHGGYSYWTDETPPGVCVYDEGVDNPLSMFEALDHLGEGEMWWKHIGVVFGYLED